MENFKSNIIALRGVAESHIGGRPENQDDMDFLDTPLGFLCIVCDGMGGGPAGKSASYIVKYEIGKALNECSPQMPRENAIKMAVAKAQEALENKMAEVPEFIGMGSTFVAVLINEDSAVVAHTGDSRCYQIRNGKVLFRTRDHSLVEELVKRKTLTEEEARLSPQSNVIIRGLGCVKNNAAEFTELPYRKGDRFILCTDGVWGAMHHKELDKRLTAKIDEKLLLDNISNEIDQIGKAQGGHHDNHTISIVCMECNSKLKDKCRKIHSFILGGFVAFFVVMVLIMYFFNVLDVIGKLFSKPQESIVQVDSESESSTHTIHSESGSITWERIRSGPENPDSVKNPVLDTPKSKEQNDTEVIDSPYVSTLIKLKKNLENLRNLTYKEKDKARNDKEELRKLSLSIAEDLEKSPYLDDKHKEKMKDVGEKLKEHIITRDKRGRKKEGTFVVTEYGKFNGHYESTDGAKKALDNINKILEEF